MNEKSISRCNFQHPHHWLAEEQIYLSKGYVLEREIVFKPLLKLKFTTTEVPYCTGESLFWSRHGLLAGRQAAGVWFARLGIPNPCMNTGIR